METAVLDHMLDSVLFTTMFSPLCSPIRTFDMDSIDGRLETNGSLKLGGMHHMYGKVYGQLKMQIDREQNAS